MLYWIVATVAAFFVKGLCGFANTLGYLSAAGAAGCDWNYPRRTFSEKCRFRQH